MGLLMKTDTSESLGRVLRKLVRHLWGGTAKERGICATAVLLPTEKFKYHLNRWLPGGAGSPFEGGIVELDVPVSKCDTILYHQRTNNFS